MLVLALTAVTPSVSAQETECIEISPGLRAAIDSGMKYYDVWMQAPRASVTYKFGFEGWIISADIGGADGGDYEGNGDMAHWFATSLDPYTAQIYQIEEGHADYLSNFPNSKEGGYDFKILDNDLGEPQNCAQNAAETTGGLGIDQDTWSKRHGPTTSTANGFQSAAGDYQFTVAEDRVSQIVWYPTVPLTPDEARAVSRDLIPDDAHLAGASADAPRSYAAQPDLYQSDWLAGRFDDTGVWNGAEPGTFVATYQLDAAGSVTAVILQTGTEATAEDQAPPRVTANAVPSSGQVAAYTLFTEEQVDPPSQRTRIELHITMDPLSGTDPLIDGIAQAVRDGLAAHPEAVTVVVFANSFDSDSGADIGRGFVSVDGLGLEGDGVGLLGPDTGEIQIELLGLDGVISRPLTP
jgi:hypothetical protein